MDQPVCELTDDQLNGVSGGFDLGTADISTVMTVVMLESAKAADAELKSMMHQMQRSNAHKAHFRV